MTPPRKGLGRGLDALLDPPISPPVRRRPKAVARLVAGRGARVTFEVAGVPIPVHGRLSVQRMAELAAEINQALGH